MDPATLALILGAAGKAGQGIMTGTSQIDRLSPEQKNRMKELERNQALGLLGLDEAQQQRILNQQLQPVQAAEREAFSRQAQQQQIADIGQGAAFRGQQALLEGAGRARSEATQRAQDVITERNALEEASQLRELAQIKAQRQMNLQGIAQIAGGVGDAALMGLGTSMAMKEAQGLEDKMLKAATEQQTKQVESKTGASKETIGFLQSFNKPQLDVPQAAQPVPLTAPITQLVERYATMQATQPEGALINFAKEGEPPYGYIVGPIDPVTGQPVSVQFKSADGSLTGPKYSGSQEYAEAMKMGGF